MKKELGATENDPKNDPLEVGEWGGQNPSKRGGDPGGAPPIQKVRGGSALPQKHSVVNHVLKPPGTST